MSPDPKMTETRLVVQIFMCVCPCLLQLMAEYLLPEHNGWVPAGPRRWQLACIIIVRLHQIKRVPAKVMSKL